MLKFLPSVTNYSSYLYPSLISPISDRLARQVRGKRLTLVILERKPAHRVSRQRITGGSRGFFIRAVESCNACAPVTCYSPLQLSSFHLSFPSTSLFLPASLPGEGEGGGTRPGRVFPRFFAEERTASRRVYPVIPSRKREEERGQAGGTRQAAFRDRRPGERKTVRRMTRRTGDGQQSLSATTFRASFHLGPGQKKPRSTL